MPSINENAKLLVTVMEAAALLSVGRSAIYKLIEAGSLQVVKLGGSSRVTMSSIRQIAGNVEPANEHGGA